MAGVISKADMIDVAANSKPHVRVRRFNPPEARQKEPIPVEMPEPEPLKTKETAEEELETLTGDTKSRLLELAKKGANNWTKDEAIEICGLFMGEYVSQGKPRGAKGYFELIIKMRGFTERGTGDNHERKLAKQTSDAAKALLKKAYTKNKLPSFVRDFEDESEEAEIEEELN